MIQLQKVPLEAVKRQVLCSYLDNGAILEKIDVSERQGRELSFERFERPDVM